MNEYKINDLYGYKDYSYLDSLIARVLKHEKVENAYCSIIFVDEKEIQKINKECRGKDEVTDVISFALEDNEDEHECPRMLGDIFVCIPRMQEQAKVYGHSEKRELSFLVVHGLLHLLGYDHQTKAQEDEMFSLQESLLNEEGIARN